MEEKKLLKKKTRAEESGNLEQLAHYCRELGEYYRKVGNYGEALNQFKQEEKVNLVLNRPVAVAVSNRMVGEIYCDIGDFKEALKYQEKHLAIAKKENSGIEEQRALANLGRTYFCMAETITKSEKEYGSYLSSAKKVYIQSLVVCEGIHGIGHLVKNEMRARLLLNIGLVLECQGNVNEAIEYVGQAIKIAKQCELFEEIFRCYSALGALHHRRGDCNKALEYFNLAVVVAERLDAHGKRGCEVLFSKAEVLFGMADFEGAKQALLKAYKLRTPDENERKSIEKNLRIAAKLCQMQRAVLSTDVSDHKALKSLYEALGDGVVLIGNFKKAIEYYLKMLECATAAGDCSRALCPIYVSLAQTYKDDCQYDLALKYSRKELEISEDTPQEACKTMLAISELLELKKAPYVEVAASYLKAKEFAVQAQDWKLLVTVLHCLQSYQENLGLGNLAEKTQRECEEVVELHNVRVSSDEEEGSGAEGESAVGGSIDLDELAESESNEGDDGDQHQTAGDLADRRSRRRKASCKGLPVQRNEKGETALHRACIAGNLTLVRRLIERGHPINIRDHCGWTPLHEACNHGHEDIVSALIESGALLNDRGGTHCGGVTPIHDAASCGHLLVVRILLSAGASVMVRTDKGETPLDCLKQWYGRVEGEIDLRTEEEFHKLAREMGSSLEKVVGQEPPVRHEARIENQLMRHDRNLTRELTGSRPPLAIHRGKSESSGLSRGRKQGVMATSREYSASHLSSEEEGAHISEGSAEGSSSDDESILISARKATKDISQWETGGVRRHSRMKGKNLFASSEYARTIASLKNHQTLLTLNKDHEQGGAGGQLPMCGEGRSPHLAEVEVDDWLEDDVRRPPLKRTKTLGGGHHVQGAGWSRAFPPSRVSLLGGQAEGHSGDPRNQSEERRGDPLGQAMAPEVAQRETSAPEELPWHQPPCPPSIQLVKVDVEGTLLLVPLDRAATFEKLAKEVARRYHEFKGVNVELTLHTPEGAVLSRNDPVTLLSSLCGAHMNVMVLVAHVTSLTLPPIAESYEKACTASHVDPSEEVSQSLEVCQAIHTLTLDDMGLGPKEFAAVAQVMGQHQNLSIRRLSLASNNVGDKGLKLLCQGLSSMQSLATLDLSCNGITAIGLSDLASVFMQQSVHSPPLQVLMDLNLSHNPIKDSGFPHLVTILSGLLSLTSLSLSNCNLSTCDLTHGNMSGFLSLDSLEHLDVSLNALGAEGVATFLATLQPAKLKVLNVSRTLGRSHPGPRKIAREVALLLTQDEMNPPSNLVELDLSQTLVNDFNLYEVIRGLEHAYLLERLGLECNPDLTSLSLRRLLQQGSWPSLCVSLSGCAKIFEYMEGDALVEHWVPVDSLRLSQVSLSVGGDAVERFVTMWERAVGSANAIVERGPFGHLRLAARSSAHLISVP